MFIVKSSVGINWTCLFLFQNPDGLYTGFIKVQLELRRPITVTGVAGMKASEAFYLPRGCVNTLHISSSNTVQQVIEALLRKFTVADNPAKFALYKRFRREDHGEQWSFIRVCGRSAGRSDLTDVRMSSTG